MNTHILLSEIQATKHCWPKKSLRSIDSWPDRRSSWSQGNKLVNSVETRPLISLRGPLQTRGERETPRVFLLRDKPILLRALIWDCRLQDQCIQRRCIEILFCRIANIFCKFRILKYCRYSLPWWKHGDSSRSQRSEPSHRIWERLWMTLRKHDILNSVDILILNIISCHKQPATSWAPCLLLQPLDGRAIQENNAQVRPEFSGPITTPYLRFDAPQTFGWWEEALPSQCFNAQGVAALQKHSIFLVWLDTSLPFFHHEEATFCKPRSWNKYSLDQLDADSLVVSVCLSCSECMFEAEMIYLMARYRPPKVWHMISVCAITMNSEILWCWKKMLELHPRFE